MKTFIMFALIGVGGVLVSGISQCEIRRQNAMFDGGLQYACNPDGTYKPLQCLPPEKNGSRYCVCYSPEGYTISGPGSVRTCACYTSAYKAKKYGGPVLDCERDGTFKKAQCAGNAWYCVDPATGATRGSRQFGACSAAVCR